ncbi:hypothetical protein [Effusibacillus lacus]|nr:hypothetical protein [Effusibacillus lacus]
MFAMFVLALLNFLKRK